MAENGTKERNSEASQEEETNSVADSKTEIALEDFEGDESEVKLSKSGRGKYHVSKKEKDRREYACVKMEADGSPNMNFARCWSGIIPFVLDKMNKLPEFVAGETPAEYLI